MRKLFIGLLSLLSTGLFAQTGKIAFKSHNGNMEYFDIAIEDGSDGGFGLPVPSKVKTYKLDSVIYVSDSVSVIVIREYRRSENEHADSAKLFRVGKDTLYKDPLLVHKHSLDSIKTVLTGLGYYVNPIKKVVFVGYDNKKNGDRKLNFTPLIDVHKGDDNSPFDMKMLLMLGTILLLSLLGGWLSWKYYQPKLQ